MSGDQEVIRDTLSDIGQNYSSQRAVVSAVQGVSPQPLLVALALNAYFVTGGTNLRSKPGSLRTLINLRRAGRPSRLSPSRVPPCRAERNLGPGPGVSRYVRHIARELWCVLVLAFAITRFFNDLTLDSGDGDPLARYGTIVLFLEIVLFRFKVRGEFFFDVPKGGL